MIEIDTVGLHPSTVSCLEALQWLHERAEFANILEIGCGNGILSIVSAGIWDAHVLAADIAPKAVEDTIAQIKLYELEANMRAIRSDGFDHTEITKTAPYDLVICNLLAELQARIALDVKNHLAPDGYLLLSGILAWKATEVEQAYMGLGFEITHKIENSPWVTTLFRNITDTNKKQPFTKA